MQKTTAPGRFQHWLYEQLETHIPGQRSLSLVNWLLVVLIMLSIALFTLDPERDVTIGTLTVNRWIHTTILTLFALEFAGRLWVASVRPRYRGLGGRLRWLRDNWFMAIVDVLAFLPELIFLVFGLPSQSWLRTLRVVRLFKMARYFSALSLVVDLIRTAGQPLLAALSAASIAWYLAAVAMFFAEHEAQPKEFGTIGDAMWWSLITLTTVGYGDVVPETTLGRIVAGIVAVIGIGTVALPRSILAGAFMHQLRARTSKGPDGPDAPRPRHEMEDG